MRSATTSIESERDCPEKPPSSGQPRAQIMSIARDVQVAPASFGLTLSFLSPLSLQFLERFLQFANVVRRQLPGVRQLRHHRGRLAAEETQDLVQHPASRDFACHERLEDIGLADLADAAQHTLSFHPVNNRLDGRVGRVGIGKCFLNLADRSASAGPESFQNPKLEFAQFGLGHDLLYYCVGEHYYHVVFESSGI